LLKEKSLNKKLSNNPLIFLQIKQFFEVKKKAGKKIKEIIIIPVKKKNVNIKFLIITKKTI